MRNNRFMNWKLEIAESKVGGFKNDMMINSRMTKWGNVELGIDVYL